MADLTLDADAVGRVVSYFVFGMRVGGHPWWGPLLDSSPS